MYATRKTRTDERRKRDVSFVCVCLPACESYSFPPSSVAVFHEGERKTADPVRSAKPRFVFSYVCTGKNDFNGWICGQWFRLTSKGKCTSHILSLPLLMLPAPIATAVQKRSTNFPKTVVIVPPPTTLMLQVQGAL